MLLSTAYLGNIQYFSKLASGEARVEACEHFQKQTYRNRTDIMTAAGVRALTVPVVWDHGRKMAIQEVRIDYTLPWQREHWRTIRTAYAASPYFDHYGEYFEPYFRYEKYQPATLFDWNSELTIKLLEILKIDQPLKLTDHYLPAGELPPGEDFRDAISHKPRLRRPDPAFSPPAYQQVFADRQPFVPNLSVIDLLFCEGPCARQLIFESAGLP